jgi:hypothetical protein
MARTAAECTDFPTLYRNTYWGVFSGDELPIAIYDNRNTFARTYKLVEHCTRLENFVEMPPFFDHSEEYKTSDGDIVLVTNPYTLSLGANSREWLLANGWTEVPPLYSTTASTWMCIVYC